MWDTSRTQVGHKGYTNGNEIICPKANVKKQDKCRQVRSECETKKIRMQPQEEGHKLCEAGRQ